LAEPVDDFQAQIMFIT